MTMTIRMRKRMIRQAWTTTPTADMGLPLHEWCDKEGASIEDLVVGLFWRSL